MAILLSIFFTLSRKVNFSGNVRDKYPRNCAGKFESKDILIFIIGTIIIALFIWMIDKFKGRISGIILNEQKASKKLIIILLCLIFLCWLPYLLSFAPGSVQGDSLNSIIQIFNGKYNNHHPVLYTLFLGIFIKLGTFLGNINIGIFIYSLVQTGIMLVGIGTVLFWLRNKYVSKIVLFIAAAYFGLISIFPSYALVLWKDPIFSVGVLLLSIRLFDTFSEKNIKRDIKNIILIDMLCFLIIFFRNNGLYIIIACMICLAVAFKKNGMRIWMSILGVVVFSLIIQGPLYDGMKIEKPKAEAFGIPIQQIAAVVVEKDGLNLSNEQKKVINQLIPIEKIEESYAPARVDDIKFNSKFNNQYLADSQKDILKVWFGLLPSNLGIYVRSYISATFGFWHPYAQNEYGYTSYTLIENDYGIHEIDLFQRIFNVSIKKNLEKDIFHIGSGTLIWIMLISMALCLKKENYKGHMGFLPPLLCWAIILCATPVAFSLRYVYVLALELPVFMVLPFLKNRY